MSPGRFYTLQATPVLKTGDISDLLDSRLDVKHDEVEVKRMATAASLCLRRSARLRPPISQVSFPLGSLSLLCNVTRLCITLSLFRGADTEHATRGEHDERR